MMQIGFIGAGKVGYSLGRYFMEHGSFSVLKPQVAGYYSQHYASAMDAAEFTKSKPYSKIDELVADSDVVFITVPDAEIENVWSQIRSYPIKDKIICHCSGALSSALFLEINQSGAYGYSIHPIMAISDKYHSYKQLSKAIFTMEGSLKQMPMMKQLFDSVGLSVQQISAGNKVKYHAATVVASNFMVALTQMSMDLLMDCGFDEKKTIRALTPLMAENLNQILDKGTVAALTGPVERGDVTTVQKHLRVLDEEDKEIYCLLSEKLLEIAKRKNPDRNYKEMEKSV